jgi:uncharacterized protein YdeI (YjbR/CyaY-like superfamily)
MPEIGKTLYVTDRRAWRSWLVKNHGKEKEIWLVYYRKFTGKPRIPYNDAVEEALCFGWIDSIQKKLDAERFAQRFSPRRYNSELSQANKERILKLIQQRKMTRAGLAAVAHVFAPEGNMESDVAIPPEILNPCRLIKQPGVISRNSRRPTGAFVSPISFPVAAGGRNYLKKVLTTLSG